MIGFIAGFFTGGFFGVALMCILSVAGRSDDDHEHDSNDSDKNKTDNEQGIYMFQRLTDRGDVDKEHIIELESGKAKLFFLKENKSENALVRVKNLLLDSYEQRVHNN